MDNPKILFLDNTHGRSSRIERLLSDMGVNYSPAVNDDVEVDIVFFSGDHVSSLDCDMRSKSCVYILFAEDRGSVSPANLSFVDDIIVDSDTDAFISFELKRIISHFSVTKENATNKLYLNTMINNIPDLVWFKDTIGRHLKVNDAFCRAVEKDKSDIEGRGHYYIWGLTKEEYEHGEFVCLESEETVMHDRKAHVFDENVKTKYGMRKFQTNKAPLINEDGKLVGTLGVAHDVTELLNMGTELRLLIKSLPDIVIIVDQNGSIAETNKLFIDYFGSAFSDVVGSNYTASIGKLRDLSAETDSDTVFDVVLPGSKERIILQQIEEPIYNVFDAPNGLICFLRDITDEQRYVDMILNESYTDYLTGLKNRRFLYDDLMSARRDDNPDDLLNVIFIDVDDFKEVNDTRGHHAGDKALQKVAHTTEKTFSNARNFRMGGDEFLSAFFGEIALDDLVRKAHLLQGFLSDPGELGFPLSISIGIANEPSDDLEKLISNGDTAMYKAKQSGKGKCCVYLPETGEYRIHRKIR